MPSILFQVGFPPVHVPDGSDHTWPCGCVVASGWDMATRVPTAVFSGCPTHDGPMRAAREAFIDMCEHPAEHRELTNTRAVDVMVAMVNAQDGHP